MFHYGHVSDRMLFVNRDWDPSSLDEVFSQNFFDFGEMWSSNVTDSELIKEN